MSVDKLKQRLKDAAEGRDRPVAAMKVKANAAFALTAGELRGACDQNPDHPHAAIFRKASRPFDDSHRLVVDRVDLEALLDDREVVTTEERVPHGNTDVAVQVKTLGERRKKATPVTPDAQKKDPKKEDSKK